MCLLCSPAVLKFFPTTGFWEVFLFSQHEKNSVAMLRSHHLYNVANTEGDTIMTMTMITRSVKLSVHKALTCPEGQSAWAVRPSLAGAKKLEPCIETR